MGTMSGDVVQAIRPADHGEAEASHYICSLSSHEACDPARVGPKSANLAALGHAGLPIPDGICLDADAYRRQLAALNLEETARRVFGSDDSTEARRHALKMKID